MFRLTYKDDGTEHGDLVLECGSHFSRGDSYFFSLDRIIEPKETCAAKVRHVLRVIFSHWLDVLHEGAQDPVYFLAELSDQCSRWIQVKPSQQNVELRVGWSTREGYGLIPSRDAVHRMAPSDFTCESEDASWTMPRQDLIRAVDRCRRMLDIQECSETDPTSILEHYRGAYGSQLLVAAVAHFDLFGQLAKGPVPSDQLRSRLGLERRPFTVLTTALCAMDLLEITRGQVSATEQARVHLAKSPFDIRDYIGLMASSPDVLHMVERLKTNRPAGSDSDTGTAFIYREGVQSAMDSSALARHFTESLAGRARIVAPVLARQVNFPEDRPATLLDVGGGSGIYSIALLARFPNLQATVLDREEVLVIAREYAERYGVEDRLHLLPGDMFQDEIPSCDRILLSNILHDWDVPECRQLVDRCAAALGPEGQLWVHDVFLNDTLTGPLPIALYSAALFSLTEGRAYSVAEYQNWLEDSGLEVTGPYSTAVHCGVLIAEKP